MDGGAAFDLLVTRRPDLQAGSGDMPSACVLDKRCPIPAINLVVMFHTTPGSNDGLILMGIPLLRPYTGAGVCHDVRQRCTGTARNGCGRGGDLWQHR